MGKYVFESRPTKKNTLRFERKNSRDTHHNIVCATVLCGISSKFYVCESTPKISHVQKFYHDYPLGSLLKTYFCFYS